MLTQEKLTLTKLEEIVKAYEASKHQITDMTTETHKQVLTVNQYNKSGEPVETMKNRFSSGSGLSSSPDQDRVSKQQASSAKICSKCGYTRHYTGCPAVGKTCKRCGKLNHFANICLSRSIQAVYASSRIEERDDNPVSEEEEVNEEFFIGAIKIYKVNLKNNKNIWLEKFEISHKMLECQLDTGAQVNLISLNKLKKNR